MRARTPFASGAATAVWPEYDDYQSETDREIPLVILEPVDRQRCSALRRRGRHTRRVDTLYDRVGGDQFFVDLVDRFYTAVEQDPVLRPLYPDEDLAEARHWLTEFLVQYWGGPRRYDEQRGHPRLRRRHAPFVIGVRERDQWWTHMSDAVRAAELAEEDEAALLAYFDMAATSMINHHGDGSPFASPRRPA